jgi:hypothetical protein
MGTKPGVAPQQRRSSPSREAGWAVQQHRCPRSDERDPQQRITTDCSGNPAGPGTTLGCMLLCGNTVARTTHTGRSPAIRGARGGGGGGERARSKREAPGVFIRPGNFKAPGTRRRPGRTTYGCIACDTMSHL